MNSNWNFEKRIRKSPDSREKTTNNRAKNPKLIERRVTRKLRLRQKGVA